MSLIKVAELGGDIERFLAFKRALGHKYLRGAFTLRAFERFVHTRVGNRERVALEAMIASWLARRTGCKAVTLSLEFGVIRQFCLFRRRTDPGGFVPDRGWGSRADSQFVPYVFSEQEVTALLQTARCNPGRNISGVTLRAFLLVLYCTGLRPGEAARLQVEDVDLQRNLFSVQESKGKSRIVPFGDDLAVELSACLRVRRQLDPQHHAFFVRRCSNPLQACHASQAICRLLRLLRLKPPSGRVGPRPYDFRHTFAVHRLTRWYKEGVDIHARLPWLSAYMGHDNVLGTESYLHATPELIAIASDRFRRRVRTRRTVR